MKLGDVIPIFDKKQRKVRPAEVIEINPYFDTLTVKFVDDGSKYTTTMWEIENNKNAYKDIKCNCGSETVGHPGHAIYCDKYDPSNMLGVPKKASPSF